MKAFIITISLLTTLPAFAQSYSMQAVNGTMDVLTSKTFKDLINSETAKSYKSIVHYKTRDSEVGPGVYGIKFDSHESLSTCEVIVHLNLLTKEVSIKSDINCSPMHI